MEHTQKMSLVPQHQLDLLKLWFLKTDKIKGVKKKNYSLEKKSQGETI